MTFSCLVPRPLVLVLIVVFFFSHQGVSNRYKQIAQTFLEKGADPNITNDYGYTALKVAIEKGNHEIVQTLLKKGANPNI